MPLVTVVIPAFNPGVLLERAIRSVLCQTSRDFEVIIVDDGSALPVDLERFPQDSRVRVHAQENRGVSVARNTGVSLGDSKYIAFLDQDDEWLPEKIARQLEEIDGCRSAAFSHTPFTWVLPDAERPSRSNAVTYESLLSGGAHVCISSVMVERAKHDAAGGHDPLLNQQQDWDFLLKLTMIFGAPVSGSKPLVRYHVHESNASKDYRSAEYEARVLLSKHAERARQRSDPAALAAIRLGSRTARRNHAHQAVDAARSSMHQGDTRAAGEHLLRAIAFDPRTAADAAGSAVRFRARTAVPRDR